MLRQLRAERHLPRDAHGLAEPPKAPDMDRALHRARVHSRSRRQLTFTAPARDLPDGSFIRISGEAWLVRGSAILHWTHQGYDRQAQRPDAQVEVLTPAPTVAVFRAGYRPMLHSSAG